jgi:hypothetical protein
MRRIGWIIGLSLIMACNMQAARSMQDEKMQKASLMLLFFHKCSWVLNTMPISWGCDRSLLGCSGECSVGFLSDPVASLCVPNPESVCMGSLTTVKVIKVAEGVCRLDCTCKVQRLLPRPVEEIIFAYKCQ